jgi:hypothetical protein
VNHYWEWLAIVFTMLTPIDYTFWGIQLMYNSKCLSQKKHVCPSNFEIHHDFNVFSTLLCQPWMGILNQLYHIFLVQLWLIPIDPTFLEQLKHPQEGMKTAPEMSAVYSSRSGAPEKPQMSPFHTGYYPQELSFRGFSFFFLDQDGWGVGEIIDLFSVRK